jgi:hypothetical protein
MLFYQKLEKNFLGDAAAGEKATMMIGGEDRVRSWRGGVSCYSTVCSLLRNMRER